MPPPRESNASLRRPRRRPVARCYALVVPGLAPLASSELRALGAQVSEVLRPRDRRDDLLLVETDAPPALLRAAIVEDVFALIADRTFDSPPHVRDIAALLARPAFERALALHHAMRPKRRSRSYKVVARVSGRQRFRRDEVHDVCERALAALLPHWVPREDATLELWAHAIGNRALVGVRLSDDTVAGRRYKRAHLPASLKPTIARALVLLVGTDAGDVVVDPMCGAGTLLHERADAGPARLVLGATSMPR